MAELGQATVSASLMVALWAAVWWLSAELLAPLYRALRPALMRAAPHAQARLLLGYSALPLALSGITTVLLWRPPQDWRAVISHCHPGIGCAPHAPTVGSSLLVVLITVLATLILVVLGLRALWQWRQHQQSVQALQQWADWMPEEGYWRLQSEAVTALTAGLFRPQIFLSTGLLQRLDAEHVEAVLAHERAHARRHDGLRLALARLWAPAVLTGPQALLVKDLRRAAELSCDADAAQQVGDALRVADAMIQAHRHQHPVATGPQTSHGDERVPDVVQRVTQLIDAPFSSSRVVAWLTLAMGTVAALTALLGVNLAHHGLEWLLG
jgi:Zn-dependent protease with chaperone function